MFVLGGGLVRCASHWSVKPVQIEEFDYKLPKHLIAQAPARARGMSRLLGVGREHNSHHHFCDVLDFLKPGDLLVLNNTRVLKARLYALKDSGGRAEMLLERLENAYQGLFQVRVSKPLKQGRMVEVGGHVLECRGRVGEFYRMHSSYPLTDLLDQFGQMPLPPYIGRDPVPEDEGRYQTVYASIPGAVAAPTAGLHFDAELLERIRKKGCEISEVTLHVGAGTFQPVRGNLANHTMHEEQISLDVKVVESVARTRSRGGRVVAVGTTVVRCLESVAALYGGQLAPYTGMTRLFIKPGYAFNVVDRLITNFHLPKSTLLMLVCAFAGRDRVLRAYAEAVRKEYRFFSYGDAMWLEADV